MTYDTPRVPWQLDALMAAIAPVDEAFRKYEGKWGVDRLPRLVSPATLESYRRGWLLWRAAIETGNHETATQIGPKMIVALEFMDGEAAAAGHTPLSVETWEAPMEDGRVLVVVRTNAEASALAAAAGLGLDGGLPPDLSRIVRHQHEGRELLVYTMGELARVLPTLDLVDQQRRAWPGTTTSSGPMTGENDIADWARQEPIRALVEGITW